MLAKIASYFLVVVLAAGASGLEAAVASTGSSSSVAERAASKKKTTKKSTTKKPKKKKGSGSSGGTVSGVTVLFAPNGNANTLENDIIAKLDAAKSTIDVAMYTFDSRPLADACV